MSSIILFKESKEYIFVNFSKISICFSSFLDFSIITKETFSLRMLNLRESYSNCSFIFSKSDLRRTLSMERKA